MEKSNRIRLYSAFAAVAIVSGLLGYATLKEEPHCPDENTGHTFDYVLGMCEND